MHPRPASTLSGREDTLVKPLDSDSGPGPGPLGMGTPSKLLSSQPQGLSRWETKQMPGVLPWALLLPGSRASYLSSLYALMTK